MVAYVLLACMIPDSSVLAVVFPAFSNFLVGFGGVLAGSLCLRRAERLLGSVVLLALGLGFEILIMGWGHGEFHIPRGAFPTGLGGLSVVAFYIWRKRQSPNDAA
jgi:hypothetical protein